MCTSVIESFFGQSIFFWSFIEVSHLTHMGQYQSVINPNGGKNTDTFVTIDNHPVTREHWRQPLQIYRVTAPPRVHHIDFVLFCCVTSPYSHNLHISFIDHVNMYLLISIFRLCGDIKMWRYNLPKRKIKGYNRIYTSLH